MMNAKERYMVTKLSGCDFEEETRELRRRVSEPSGKRYNRSMGARGGCSGQTSKLARYRSLCLRQNRLRKEILEKEAFYRKALAQGAQPSWFRAGREKNELEVMRAQLAALKAKTDECLAMAEGADNRLREAMRYRYLDMSLRELPSWKKTAEHIGFDGSAEELRHKVVEFLSAKSSIMQGK